MNQLSDITSDALKRVTQNYFITNRYHDPNIQREFTEISDKICSGLTENEPLPLNFTSELIRNTMVKKSSRSNISNFLSELLSASQLQSSSLNINNFLLMFPFFVFSSLSHDPRLSDRSHHPSADAFKERLVKHLGTSSMSLTMTANKFVYPLWSEQESCTASSLIKNLANFTCVSDLDHLMNIHQNLIMQYGEDYWRKRQDFVDVLQGLRMFFLQSEKSNDLIWNNGIAPSETIIVDHLKSMITNLVENMFKIYNLVDNRTITGKIGEHDTPERQGHLSSTPDILLYYTDDHDNWKYLTFFEVKRSWCFDSITIGQGFGNAKYSLLSTRDSFFGLKKSGHVQRRSFRAQFEEGLGIFRQFCTYCRNFHMRYGILTCGIKTYLIRINIELLKELYGNIDEHSFNNSLRSIVDNKIVGLNKIQNWKNFEFTEAMMSFVCDTSKALLNKGRRVTHVDAEEDIVMVPISYTVFSCSDDIPLHTSIAAILLHLANLPQDELNLSIEETNFFDRILRRY